VEYRDYALLSGQQSSSTAVYRLIWKRFMRYEPFFYMDTRFMLSNNNFFNAQRTD